MKAQLPHPRQQQGGGCVLGAPGKLVDFSEPPFPHLGCRVARPQRAPRIRKRSRDLGVGKGTGSPETGSLQTVSLTEAAAREPLPSSSQQLGWGDRLWRGTGCDRALPGSRGMGSGFVRSTPRVWDPGPHARFGKISRESYRMPELPRGWGPRRVCASCRARPALANSNPTDSSGVTGEGHWCQRRPELPASGLCGPPAACEASPGVTAPLEGPSTPPSTLPLPWPGPAFKV